MQDVAWTLSLLVMGVIAAVFLWVAAGASSTGGDAGAITREAYRLRAGLFWIAIAAGVAISFATLWSWPMPGHVAAAPKPDAVIKAVGHQWRWELDKDTVRVGQLVEFEITAADVNHGFGIYRDKHHLVAQTQAMPGYVNRLRVRFTEPGEYEVLCLEYCGLAHHAMRAVVKVSGQ
ncbi:MAG: hypothetical protein IT529_15630 [Burkholderiales bacterium]|nr:hypothetical protein [Burkholderiales bacterium]